jgi:hypothetical protein
MKKREVSVMVRKSLRSSRKVSGARRYQFLREFISTSMRMSHVYQPVMIATLLQAGGQAFAERIAKALLAQDRSQIEYYVAVVRDMVGRVLAQHGVVRRSGTSYFLKGYERLTAPQQAELRALCKSKLDEYIRRRGKAIWEHRTRGLSEISGRLRYEGRYGRN